jgi:hypothetical protein
MHHEELRVCTYRPLLAAPKYQKEHFSSATTGLELLVQLLLHNHQINGKPSLLLHAHHSM